MKVKVTKKELDKKIRTPGAWTDEGMLILEAEEVKEKEEICGSCIMRGRCVKHMYSSPKQKEERKEKLIKEGVGEICKTENCKLNHVRVCNAIECNYVEVQPHLHHSSKHKEECNTKEASYCDCNYNRDNGSHYPACKSFEKQPIELPGEIGVFDSQGMSPEVIHMFCELRKGHNQIIRFHKKFHEQNKFGGGCGGGC